MIIIAIINFIFNVILLYVFSDHEHGHLHSHRGLRHQHNNYYEANHQNHSNQNIEKVEHDISNKQNVNIAAAYAHALGDLAESIGILTAGIILTIFPKNIYPKAQLADPIATYRFSLFGLYATWSVFYEIIRILMQGAPKEIDLDEVLIDIKKIKFVVDVHHIHCWSINSHENAFSAHVVCINGKRQQVMHDIIHYLNSIGIEHTTIQVYSEIE